MHHHFFAYGKELRARIHGDNENALRLRIQRPGMTHVLKPVLLLKEVDAGSACDDYASRVDRKRTLRLIQVNEAPRKTLHPSKQRRVAPTNTMWTFTKPSYREKLPTENPVLFL